MHCHLGKSFLFASLLLGLSACQSQFHHPHRHYPSADLASGASTGGILAGTFTGAGIVGVGAGAIGNYYNNPHTLTHILETYGAQVMAVGDTLRVVLPSDRFFYPVTDELRPEADLIIVDLGKLLMNYGHTLIEVKGYTDNMWGEEPGEDMSKRQASKIASLLWGQGLNAKLLDVKGEGSKDSTASNRTKQGSAANRRVELILRRYPT